jgi:hypothetical protein
MNPRFDEWTHGILRIGQENAEMALMMALLGLRSNNASEAELTEDFDDWKQTYGEVTWDKLLAWADGLSEE